MKNERLTIFAYQLALLLGILAVWETSAALGWIDAQWVSSPSLLAGAFKQSLTNGELLRHTGVTLGEAFAGLAVGVLAGVLLGLLLGLSRTLGATLEPFIVALNALPRVALAPLIVMFVGIGFASKFLLAFSLVVVPMMINTYEGIKSVDPVLINALRVLSASRLQVFFKLLLPACVPWLFSGIRVSISFAIVGAIVGELISSRAGIGYMIDSAAGSYDITGMLMPLIALMLVAFIFDRFVLWTSDRLLRWRETAR